MPHEHTLQQAYVLHARPYRNTSLLVDFFSADNGRIPAIARGVKRPKSSLKGLLQPFTPLLITWSGRTDLVNLRIAEPDGSIPALTGRHLLSGLYINELLVRLLQRFDPHPVLFAVYGDTVRQLAHAQLTEINIEIILRCFELKLLQALGYGLQLDRVSKTGELLQTEQYYRFRPKSGISRIDITSATQVQLEQEIDIFKGAHLLAIDKRQFDHDAILNAAKQLVRIAMSVLLTHPLKSRELFLQQQYGNKEGNDARS